MVSNAGAVIVLAVPELLTVITNGESLSESQ